MTTLMIALLLLCASLVTAWVSPTRPSSPLQVPSSPSDLSAVSQDHDDSARRAMLTVSSVVTCTFLLGSTPAHALVKGNAPPPNMKPSGEKLKCTNVEECQAMAERKQAEESSLKIQGPPPKISQRGTRYIDMDIGDESKSSVKDGDEVTIYYKVLKLGKRSYDGLSGEGTVVFSRGYGLEDDEKAPGTKSFKAVVGSPFNIAALNDGVLGMHIGGTRRISILPQKGWEKPTTMCDGGPGGEGAGGDKKTDYVIVPTATMVATEACFDTTKQPFPTTYAQERRMAQRFDQSLIMEVQLVGIGVS